MRYLRFLSRLWKSSRVEGFTTTAERKMRDRRMNRVHKPVMIRSPARRLGARLRPRFQISRRCRTSTDSAITLRSPPGLASRTTMPPVRYLDGENPLSVAQHRMLKERPFKATPRQRTTATEWLYTLQLPNLPASREREIGNSPALNTARGGCPYAPRDAMRCNVE